MAKLLRLALMLGLAANAMSAPSALPSFKKRQLTDKFWSEGAAFGDFNHDGVVDLVYGPFWYEGPDFSQVHAYAPADATFVLKRPDGTAQTIPGFPGALTPHNGYSNNFYTFVHDFNGDGWDDILVIDFPGKGATWYENPRGGKGHWMPHLAAENVENESPVLADLKGTGRPVLLCCSGGYIGYYEADWKNPAARWTFHPITPKGNYQRFTHGLGFGDINGDGRADVIENDGWWEQPASLAGDPVWKKHPYSFAVKGAQILVYDVNGDGRNDVISCVNAHGYGISWHEQIREDGVITFREHVILNPTPTPNAYGVSFTQPHSLALVDIDGDGVKDLVTGKRFWAHGHQGPDPESDNPAVLYWFKIQRSPDGRVEFVPHLIDSDSGVGTQVVAGMITRRDAPDILVGNKKGLFLFRNERR